MMHFRTAAVGAALVTFLSVKGYAQVPQAARDAYARVLSTYVEDGRVDYKGLGKDRGDLDRYVEAVAKAELPRGRDERIGFYVDAYNALVLSAVIAHGRPRSVLDVKGFFNQRKHRVAGRDLTLDELEKETLNPFAKDPRTHFVVVCGAVGCPILESKPYYGSNLDRRFEAATRRYLGSPQGARVEGGKLVISKIFDWYAADFGGAEGAKAFVLKRLPADTRGRLAEAPEVGFVDYNWTLNQQ
ncbi:MAG: DUF547 domain-containing protein [Myxococcota bacterium]